jgi:hypothetical protein
MNFIHFVSPFVPFCFPGPAHNNRTDIGVRSESIMKRLIIATSIALSVACAGSVSAAQDQVQATNLQYLTVTAPPGQYETYVLDLGTGYGLEAFVGNTRSEYVQAERAAESSEALRKLGIAPQPFVAVAIDNSIGPGVARRILLTDPAQSTVAIVDVYCKRAVPAGGKHCQLFNRQVQASA